MVANDFLITEICHAQMVRDHEEGSCPLQTGDLKNTHTNQIQVPVTLVAALPHLNAKNRQRAVGFQMVANLFLFFFIFFVFRVSWQVQYFVDLAKHISWQMQDFVGLGVQSLWQAQDFLWALECRFRGRRKTLWTLKCRFRGRCSTLWMLNCRKING